MKNNEAIEIPINDFSNQVSILQIKSFNAARIKSYFNSISKNSVVLFAEYILDPFFSSIKNIPAKDFDNTEKLALLKEYSKEYNHLLVVPFIELKDNAYFKNLALIYDDLIFFYPQNTLISYSHWDERSFFANTEASRVPFYFNIDHIRFGIIFGFEAHFNEYWLGLKQNEVDVVLIPTASTFNSKDRWRNLLKIHAFTNSCYILRANKLGVEFSSDGVEWDFYGDSSAFLGDRLIDSLEDREGILCIDIEMQKVKKLAKEWGFRDFKER